MNTHHPQSITSNSSGFENIGKFYKYIRSIQKEKNLSWLDISIYMILVEYSFGYMKNIQYEIQISIKKLMEELETKTNKKIIKSLKKLQDESLIERIEWQNFGPKQGYKYKVLFPEGFSIKHKPVMKKKEQLKREYIPDI